VLPFSSGKKLFIEAPAADGTTEGCRGQDDNCPGILNRFVGTINEMRWIEIPEMPFGRSEVVRTSAALLILALGIRVAFLYVDYVIGSSTKRFHVESAALLFVLCGLLFQVFSRRPRVEPSDPDSQPLWLLPMFIAVSVFLYFPSLSVGLLSDDFVLLQRASEWRIGPAAPELFRPLPLAVWGLLLKLGAGPYLLHLLNVLIHGANAYLTSRVVASWVGTNIRSVLAGLLLLTSPISVEPVVWCSGLFDLLATFFVLILILVARRYSCHQSFSTRVAFLSLALLALASKETGAIAVGLVMLDAWLRQSLPRTLLLDSTAVLLTVGLIAAARVEAAYGTPAVHISKYIVQRVVFASVGSFSVPWHIEVIRAHPWLPIVTTLYVLVLFASYFVCSGPKPWMRRATGAGAWILLALLPVWPFFFVGQDLQSSRYCYLPSVGWATLLTIVVSHVAMYRDKWVGVIAAPLLLTNVYGVILHQGPWKEAAEVRDRIEASAARLSNEGCQKINIVNPPELVRGAYLFRNGLPEALWQAARLNATVGAKDDRCSFRWVDRTNSFVRVQNPRRR
jgi:protein O-mannosyl-transferase